jgi:hypothetical protein
VSQFPRTILASAWADLWKSRNYCGRIAWGLLETRIRYLLRTNWTQYNSPNFLGPRFKCYFVFQSAIVQETVYRPAQWRSRLRTERNVKLSSKWSGSLLGLFSCQFFIERLDLASPSFTRNSVIACEIPQKKACLLLIHNHAILSRNFTLSTYNIVLLLVVPLTSLAVNDRQTLVPRKATAS